MNPQSSISEESYSSKYFMTNQSINSRENKNSKIYKYFEKKQYEEEFSNMTKAFAKKKRRVRKK